MSLYVGNLWTGCMISVGAHNIGGGMDLGALGNWLVPARAVSHREQGALCSCCQSLCAYTHTYINTCCSVALNLGDLCYQQGSITLVQLKGGGKLLLNCVAVCFLLGKKWSLQIVSLWAISKIAKGKVSASYFSKYGWCLFIIQGKQLFSVCSEIP